MVILFRLLYLFALIVFDYFMSFKSDRQRRAVMARLSPGRTIVSVSPKSGGCSYFVDPLTGKRYNSKSEFLKGVEEGRAPSGRAEKEFLEINDKIRHIEKKKKLSRKDYEEIDFLKGKREALSSFVQEEKFEGGVGASIKGLLPEEKKEFENLLRKSKRYNIPIERVSESNSNVRFSPTVYAQLGTGSASEIMAARIRLKKKKQDI